MVKKRFPEVNGNQDSADDSAAQVEEGLAEEDLWDGLLVLATTIASERR
jgi:hypothetical protein